MDRRRAWGRFAAIALALPVLFGPAAAADYPDKVVKLIIPWPSGGGTDVIGRVIAQELSRVWSQSVIVDNRGGASGNIGAMAAAGSPADGYTLLLATITLATNPSIYGTAGFNPQTDLAPISLVAGIPHVLAVNPNLPAHNVQELVALAKSKPGKLNYASAGSGSPFHLAAALFNSLAHTNIVHVPYKGGGPAVTDVIGGQPEMTFANIVAVMPQVKNGRLRALGITSKERSGAYPDLPTIAEQGLPGYDFSSWFGILAPKGTPADVVAKVNRDVVAVLKTPAVQGRFINEGANMVGSTPEQFAAFLAADTARWRTVIREAGIKAE